MSKRPRSQPGERNPAHKLRWSDVRMIRRRRKSLNKRGGKAALARLYGVSRSRITEALQGKTWRIK